MAWLMLPATDAPAEAVSMHEKKRTARREVARLRVVRSSLTGTMRVAFAVPSDIVLHRDDAIERVMLRVGLAGLVLVTSDHAACRAVTPVVLADDDVDVVPVLPATHPITTRRTSEKPHAVARHKTTLGHRRGKTPLR
jgi:hypothetical protein